MCLLFSSYNPPTSLYSLKDVKILPCIMYFKVSITIIDVKNLNSYC